MTRPSTIFGDRLFGLALLLGGLLGDAALGLDRLGRNLLAGEEARAGGGDVHRQAACGVLAATGVLHRDADGRGQVGGALVQVGAAWPWKTAKRLSTSFSPMRADSLSTSAATDWPSTSVVQQGVDVGRLLGQDDVEQTLGELDEVGVLGDEVGLAVELEQGAVLADDDTVGGRALEALADVLGALDAQELDGLVVVAVGLGRAFLQSIIPAPVASRRRLTSAAVNSAMSLPLGLWWCEASFGVLRAVPAVAETAPDRQPFWAPWVPVLGRRWRGRPRSGRPRRP